jgi:hypothetical protein
MPTFHGGMRELADHKRPWVRLAVDAEGARLGPWMVGVRRMPTYSFRWTEVERIEPVTDRYLNGPGVRFVLRRPVAAMEGSPNAARWPDARRPVFLCGSDRRLRDVLAALPAELVAAEPAPAPSSQPQSGATPTA